MDSRIGQAPSRAETERVLNQGTSERSSFDIFVLVGRSQFEASIKSVMDSLINLDARVVMLANGTPVQTAGLVFDYAKAVTDLSIEVWYAQHQLPWREAVRRFESMSVHDHFFMIKPGVVIKTKDWLDVMSAVIQKDARWGAVSESGSDEVHPFQCGDVWGRIVAVKSVVARHELDLVRACRGLGLRMWAVPRIVTEANAEDLRASIEPTKNKVSMLRMIGRRWSQR